MGQPSRKQGESVPSFAETTEELSALRSRAVAIDPPPSGAIGIKELLDRFEQYSSADELIDPPENGAVGVRELLGRLKNLAESGFFASPRTDDSGEP